ncbi:MAG: hypothetical protein JNM17_07945 [Archangium sp.]|nr:hypothetical protein [Archangium sp.]
MNSSLRLLAVAATWAVLLSGCIRSPIAMMTSTRPLEQNQYVELGPVEENDCIVYILGFIPVSSANNMQAAMRDAIKKSGGDALIQVTAETFYQNFLFFSRYCTVIQGIAVRSAGSQPPPAPPR